MSAAKLKRLQSAGWKTGGAREFLGLSDEEAMLVDLKLSLTDAVRQFRQRRGLSQIDLALRMGSSQSRIAKLETGDPSVSLDLIVRSCGPFSPPAALARSFSARSGQSEGRSLRKSRWCDLAAPNLCGRWVRAQVGCRGFSGLSGAVDFASAGPTGSTKEKR